MFEQLFESFSQCKQFEALIKSISLHQSPTLYDVSEGERAFICSALIQKLEKPVLYIANNVSSAMRLTDDFSTFLQGQSAYFPSENFVFTNAYQSREGFDSRIEALSKLKNNEIKVLVTTVEALQTRVPSKETFDKFSISLSGASVFPPHDLIKTLVYAGYERVEMVEGKGQCALRGEIVDVYPPSSTLPYRIEFFDDEVDSLRTFDPISQRSLEKFQHILLPPAQPFLYDEKERDIAADNLQTYVKTQLRLFNALDGKEGEDIEIEDENHEAFSLSLGLKRLLYEAEQLRNGVPLKNAHLFEGVLTKRDTSILSWIKDAIVIIDTPENIKSRADDHLNGFLEDFKYAIERKEVFKEQEVLVKSFDTVMEELSTAPLVFMQDFLRGTSGLKSDISLSLKGAPSQKYTSNIKQLSEDIVSYRNDNFKIYLLSGGQARGERLQKSLQAFELYVPIQKDAPLNKEACIILPVTLSKGFIYQDAKFALISDGDIFGSGYKKAKKTRTAGEKIEAFTDLKEGDFVVHESHGVGIYQGTVRLKTEGTYRDYLYIQYRGNDKLYVPTDQFDRVQKYIGGQDVAPKLNSLNSTDWDKQKSKVKAGLKKLAFDLVKLYAKRRATKGYAFAKDTPWLRQFEDAFPYELTRDQAQAVVDIESDMEAPINMDRLLCGDVGYGKTEVALRAAFKAVTDNKQVAFLAPTTILAQQHYYTLIKRLKEFPVTVDVLSRFRTKKQQDQTIRNLKEGNVDILVGTHRLLSKDVVFKDLGLLIVDEEQRFGVQHKESIKNMKDVVDVLTLSATPIPRTLHMSMVGVRDMSLLETPPEQRLPVQTYVMEYNDSIIRDAIRRELQRKGQTYVLYNRVGGIERFKAHLSALLPEANIVIAHGQMKENQLEDIMTDFFNGKYDVLLSTTIIENGLDVPNANTLIVYDADKFGLSQLYQLRGRVGRSNRMAYAYFTVRPDKMISEDAQKRLNAIREFTEFGSGFRIAMRDLEIRGAGNIFGPEQSGNVSIVGYDLYVKLIEEAVLEAQGEEGEKPFVKPRADTRIDMKIDAYLPKEYVQSESQRMEVYKRIALIRSKDDREDVIEELIDRFGDPKEPVMRLIDIAHLKAIVSQLGVTRITFKPGIMTLKVEPALLPDFETLVSALSSTDTRLVLSALKEPAILFKEKQLTENTALTQAIPLFEKVLRLIYNDEKGTN